MVVLLIGQQGAGKSTLGQALRETCGACFVSGGVLIRREIDAQTEIGLAIEGQINHGYDIEPELLYELLTQELERNRFEPLVLDGFPGGADEEDLLIDTAGKPDLVLHLDGAPTHELVQRIQHRRECPDCFMTYPPGEIDRCVSCKTPLRQRPEDTNRDKIRIRHHRWSRKGKGVVSLYRSQGILTPLDSSAPPEVVLERALAVLPHERRKAADIAG